MATRSTIALEFADGTIGQVYAHWDGYLSHNGRILVESYSDPFKLQKLIDLGGLSSLGTEIGVQHPFDNPGRFNDAAYLEYKTKYGNMCKFYGRDRGETEMEATYFKDFADYVANCQREEYDYILRNVNGVATWFVSEGRDFVVLTLEMTKESE